MMVINQRKHVRWGRHDRESEAVVVPAKVLLSNTSSSLIAAVDAGCPALSVAALKNISSQAWRLRSARRQL
eukprot:857805-Alexandrium_andersonii.AAC.1